jgi:hypothetical protein
MYLFNTNFILRGLFIVYGNKHLSHKIKFALLTYVYMIKTFSIPFGSDEILCLIQAVWRILGSRFMSSTAFKHMDNHIFAPETART